MVFINCKFRQNAKEDDNAVQARVHGGHRLLLRGREKYKIGSEEISPPQIRPASQHACIVYGAETQKVRPCPVVFNLNSRP